MNVTDPETEAILNNSRFWIQRVIVPLVVCIGVVGNTVTVMVLTRRRMRSSTNIYLSALAIADILHNFFVLVLSFKHYPNVHDKKYELFWRFYGISHWLCDAASSTSVWLTVSFTLERYIAVCHPIKGKVLCTENRAKSIISIIYIFCLLTTMSTTFEYQLTLEESCIKQCPVQPAKKTQYTTGNLMNSNGTTSIHIQHHDNINEMAGDNPNIKLYTDALVKSLLANCSKKHTHIIYIPISNITANTDLVESQIVPPATENVIENDNVTSTMITMPENETMANNTECCLKKFTIDTEPTTLGSNSSYSTFMAWYSAIVFFLLPLIVIATFNCFLIQAVYYSQKARKAMTNSQENISISNENRITVMLIGVVILFLVCQTPTATFLIYKNIHETKNKRELNIELIAGNVFNLMQSLNSSCNFVVYCMFSKKFRSTFKKLFWERRKKRQDTIALSSCKSRNSQKFNPYKGMRRNASEYITPRNLETQSLTGIPRSKSLMVRPAGKAKSTDLIV
ncbi:unnamed protein product [Brassicogethes aeneus]|uniref:G-protein coupled receptors family 1 profile domain-containing protein n=1 Tax=Brassicogethes aeneus TaxID=1431903 RepID=A0A9P0FCM7_BRAAE|nr:unnamed protein product [Brassicogethes aeneus]